jgi:hypothetical protein
MKILLIFFLLTGCSTFLIKEKEKEFICTKIDCGDENIEQLTEEERKKNIIACIKLLPECINE